MVHATLGLHARESAAAGGGAGGGQGRAEGWQGGSWSGRPGEEGWLTCPGACTENACHFGPGGRIAGISANFSAGWAVPAVVWSGSVPAMSTSAGRGDHEAVAGARLSAVFRLEIGTGGEDRLGGLALGDQAHDRTDRDPQAADAGASAHLAGLEGDALEWSGLRDHKVTPALRVDRATAPKTMRQKLASVVSGPSSLSLGRTNGRTLAQVSPPPRRQRVRPSVPRAAASPERLRPTRRALRAQEFSGHFPIFRRFSEHRIEFSRAGEGTPMRHFCSTMAQMCTMP